MPHLVQRKECKGNTFLTELPSLFSAHSHPILLGGDFKCTLQPIDSTGQIASSRALEEIIWGLALTDTWTQDPQRPAYMHYSPTGATRIDCIYMSTADINRKTRTEIIPTMFMDHHAVVLRLTLPAHEVMRTRGRWKMDPTMAQDDNIRGKIKQEWAKWRQYKRFYLDIVAWWEHHVKPHLKRLVRREEVECNKQHNIMENHLYECLYDTRGSQ